MSWIVVRFMGSRAKRVLELVWVKREWGCMSSNVYKIFFFFLFRCFINLFTDEVVLNIIAPASGYTKLIFLRWKTRNPMSSPIPEHKKSRFWLFSDKFVIAEAILNIIVQATAFARVFFSTWRFKKSKSNRSPRNRVFLTTLIRTHVNVLCFMITRPGLPYLKKYIKFHFDSLYTEKICSWRKTE